MGSTDPAEPRGDAALPADAVVDRDGLRVSRSPWGPADEIGRLNWITAASRIDALAGADAGRVFDLSVDYFIGMPSWVRAGDPTYQIWMTHTPQGSVNHSITGVPSEVYERHSSSGDAILMTPHMGTHFDTLNHIGHHGKVWNGWSPEVDLGSRHWLKCGAEKFPPMVARGILIDVAALHGVECLPDSYAVTEQDIRAALDAQGTTARRGDVVLVRKGRMARWPDADAYMLDSPGLGLAAARYLCEDLGAMCLGTDTIALEVLPPDDPNAFLPVHGYLLSTVGAPILEVVNLEELAAERLYEFAFVALPLKLVGATGTPCRPIAMPLRG